MGLTCNSVRPIRLGLGHNVISVRPISAMSKHRVGQANSMGLIAHFGKTETLRRETERLQSHLGETEIPIGRTELLGFGSGL